MGQGSQWSGRLLEDYQVEARNADLSLTFLTHRHTRQHCLLREFAFSEPKDCEAMEQQLQRRMQQPHPTVTRLLSLQKQEQDSLCSRVFRLAAVWEHWPKTLAEEVRQRGLERRPFEGREVMAVLRALVGGVLHFCAVGGGYDGLTSRSLLVGEDGLRLADPLMQPALRNLQVVHAHRNIKNVYLSPQECAAVEMEAQGEHWRPADAVFTAAIIVLEAALLERQDACYLRQNSAINQPILLQQLQRVRERYGGELADTLAGMLELEAERRTDLRDLWGRLQGEHKAERQTHHPATKKLLPMMPVSASRVSNPTKPQPALFSNQKLRLSLAESSQAHSPHRLFETTHMRVRRSEQEVLSASRQRPLPLLEMKTINTTTEMQPSAPLFSFERELSTSPLPKPSPEAASCEANTSDSELVLHKYEHHSTPPSTGYFVEEFKLGSRYEGQKVGGRREGWGRLRFQDGGVYEGEWRNNKMEGFGRLYYRSGQLAYEGQWQADQFSGHGKLHNEDCAPLTGPYDYRQLRDGGDYWLSYQGAFVRDAKQGEGELRLSNGEYFRGRFEADEITGDGEYYCKDGRKVRGRWRRGVLESIAEVTTHEAVA